MMKRQVLIKSLEKNAPAFTCIPVLGFYTSLSKRVVREFEFAEKGLREGTVKFGELTSIGTSFCKFDRK